MKLDTFYYTIKKFLCWNSYSIVIFKLSCLSFLADFGELLFDLIQVIVEYVFLKYLLLLCGLYVFSLSGNFW